MEYDLTLPGKPGRHSLNHSKSTSVDDVLQDAPTESSDIVLSVILLSVTLFYWSIRSGFVS